MGQHYFPSDDSLAQQPYVIAKMSADQTLTTGSQTIVQFDTIDNSRGDDFNTSTYTYLTPSAGVYLIIVNLTWANSASGNRYIFMKGLSNKRNYSRAVEFTDHNLVTLNNSLGAQSIFVEAKQSSGGNLNINKNRSQLSILRLY